MANPLFQMMNQNNIISQFMQFKNSFTGDPRAQIQQMLNSGKLTQDQYNQAVQQAQQFQQMLGAFKGK